MQLHRISLIAAKCESVEHESANWRQQILDEQRRNSDLQDQLATATRAEREARRAEREARKALKAGQNFGAQILQEECDELRQLLAASKQAEHRALTSQEVMRLNSGDESLKQECEALKTQLANFKAQETRRSNEMQGAESGDHSLRLEAEGKVGRDENSKCGEQQGRGESERVEAPPRRGLFGLWK